MTTKAGWFYSKLILYSFTCRCRYYDRKYPAIGEECNKIKVKKTKKQEMQICIIFWEPLLHVPALRRAEKLLLNHRELFLWQIPSAHLSELSVWGEAGEEPLDVRYPRGEGLRDTDFVLYVQAVSSSDCTKVYLLLYIHEMINTNVCHNLFIKHI